MIWEGERRAAYGVRDGRCVVVSIKGRRIRENRRAGVGDDEKREQRGAGGSSIGSGLVVIGVAWRQVRDRKNEDVSLTTYRDGRMGGAGAGG